MPTNRVYRIAVIPGDGIGKEVVPEGVRVLETAAKKFGFELRQDDYDFALVRLLRQARAHDAGGLEKRRSAATTRSSSARSAGRRKSPITFHLGLAHHVPPRVRPIRQSPPGAADAGRAVAARQSQARRHRLLGGARKYRRRIFRHRRPHCSAAPTAKSWCRKP